MLSLNLINFVNQGFTMIRNLITTLLFAIAASATLSCSGSPAPTSEKGTDEKIIVAYVTSWSDVIPDPSNFTHLNYAFGHVNDTFDGVRIDNPERFRQMIGLKEKYPHLKVMLSIGGWGSGRFSEMAASDSLRKAFANDCNKLIEEYKFDGIDIDWEYPTIDWAGISSSEDDTANFTLLMQDLRRAISSEKLLTLASSSTARYIDFKSVAPIVDFVNLMTYDMSDGDSHHAPLYSSVITSEMTADKSVRLHREAGLTDDKIVLGIPFYGRGVRNGEHYYCDFKDIKPTEGESEAWDAEAQVPYLTDAEGNFVFGYDNPRSVAVKCAYILENNLKGAMYWDYNGDNASKSLSSTIHNMLNGLEYENN